MMHKLAVQFLDQGFHRVLFDAMPMPVLVVDDDVCILEYNTAAARLLGEEKAKVVRRRGGEVLRCIHAVEAPGGCGRSPHCLDCVVRKSVQAATQGRRVTRLDARMERFTDTKRVKVGLRVGCHPFTYQGQSFCLLILEGLDDLPARNASARP